MLQRNKVELSPTWTLGSLFLTDVNRMFMDVQFDIISDHFGVPGRAGAGLRLGKDISGASMLGFGRVDAIVCFPWMLA